MNASSSKVRGGVSFRCLFQTKRATSWGEERGPSVFCGRGGGVAEASGLGAGLAAGAGVVALGVDDTERCGAAWVTAGFFAISEGDEGSRRPRSS